jgi:serine/threonine protein kinase/DNA-directed RNA polymerase subunit RPC12/RpoP
MSKIKQTKKQKTKIIINNNNNFKSNSLNISNNEPNNKTIYKCNKCQIVFTMRKNLYRHIREKHEKIKFLECPYCSKKVPRLKEHMQRCPKGISNKISSLYKKEMGQENQKINKNEISEDFTFYSQQYKAINKKIGEGTFGSVYFGIALKSNNYVAIKKIKNENIKIAGFQNEVDILKELNNEICFSKYFYSEFSKNNKIIIQSLLGVNLKVLKEFCGGKFPLYTILNIGIELFERISIIHKHGILHRDLKPSNILYGNFTTSNKKEKDSLFIIDFGLSKKFINNNKHWNYSITQKFVGTGDYASRHSLNGEKVSRRDDVESIIYILVYLFNGSLPWSDIKDNYSGSEKYEKIRENMVNIDPKTLLKGLPNVFEFIYKNIIILDFKEEPPYEHFITLLEKEKNKILKDIDKNEKYKFIWTEHLKQYFNSNENGDYCLSLIQNLFHGMDLHIIKKYFEDIKKESYTV